MSMNGIDPEETAETLERDPGHQGAADLIRQMAARIAELEAQAAGTGPAAARLLGCGLCYEEQGEEVHPHPECQVGQRGVSAGVAPAGRAALLREVAEICDEAGAVYASKALNDHADGAFTLMERFLRKADEAEYVATPCSAGGCEPGGEPCSTHERLMAHAEGDHELCEPDCGVTLAVLPAPADRAAGDLAAATCSAQYHGCGEDGARLCIRAAQHLGKAHTDEHGFHWSDTVAVYPLADGQFRTGINVRAELRRMAAEAQQPETPLRAELKPWQLLGDASNEPLPQTERLVGGRRLTRGEAQQPEARKACGCGQDGCEYCDVGDDADEEQQAEAQAQCRCPHPVDEHSVYGCADGCACEWVPKRPPMDPVHILGIYADEQPAAVSQPGKEA